VENEGHGKGKGEGMSAWESCSLRFVPDLSFNLFQTGKWSREQHQTPPQYKALSPIYSPTPVLITSTFARLSCLIIVNHREKHFNMADPFEVRMRFTAQLQHLNASVNSAQKAALYAVRHQDMDEDLHSCILEQLGQVSCAAGISL